MATYTQDTAFQDIVGKHEIALASIEEARTSAEREAAYRDLFLQVKAIADDVEGVAPDKIGIPPAVAE